MDYVVFGIGFGATILVLGLLIRDIGPGLRYRKPSAPDGVFHAEELVAKVAWTRFTRSLGAVLAIGGVAFLIATGICMVLMLSDGTGGWVMLGSMVTFYVLMLIWTWAFFDRFGSYGILPEREEPAAPEPVVRRESPATRRPRERQPERPGARPVQAPSVGPVAPESAVADPPPEEPPVEAEPEETPGDVGREAIATPAEEPAEVQTPEERLERMESPIDHGSAEDDLDIAASGKGRPRRGRPEARLRGDEGAEPVVNEDRSEGGDEPELTLESEPDVAPESEAERDDNR